jgi:hypothetical protein
MRDYLAFDDDISFLRYEYLANKSFLPLSGAACPDHIRALPIPVVDLPPLPNVHGGKIHTQTVHQIHLPQCQLFSLLVLVDIFAFTLIKMCALSSTDVGQSANRLRPLVVGSKWHEG